MSRPAAAGPSGALPLLPTTVIGSFAVPEWLGQLRNDYHQHRISARYLDQATETAIKAAILDQERAGIDIISDGELRRDNDTDYLLAAIPGVRISGPPKADWPDYYEAAADAPLPEPAAGDDLGLAAEFGFARQLTDMPLKVSITGPFSLSRRITGHGYAGPAGLVRALARQLRAEAQRLADAGAALLQIDEPFLAGYPEDIALATEAINIVTDVPGVSWTLHVCYGNRYARPLWASHYDFLFPYVNDTPVDRLALEFARQGDEDLRLLERYHWDRELGLGTVNVKSGQVETLEVVADRIRRALRYVPARRLVINPDCGMRQLRPQTAQAKLDVMVAAAAQVRAELEGAGMAGPGGRPPDAGP
jgi:5-methyltetrahydropteroyltriglutamate--homocysteine methyltransferase